MLACLAGVLTVTVTTNWVVNPYGVWPTTVVPRAYRLTGAGADELGERLTTPYRLRVEQPVTLLVGSSRVLKGMVVDQSGHEAFLNAGLSGATLTELAGVLRLATVNPHLQHVIWGVEFYAFDEKYVPYDPQTRRRLEANARRALTMRITETLFNMEAFRDSRRVLWKAARRQKPGSLTDPVPWTEDLIKERFARVSQQGLIETNEATIRRQLSNWIVSYVDYRPSPRQFSLFQETVVDLRGTGRDVILFVPPLSDCELETIDQSGGWDAFQRWKRDLLKVGPYWDYSGYGKLDLLPQLFTDVPHFKPAVGQVILRRALGLDCAGCGEKAKIIWDAGVWVDPTTVDAYLAGQEAARAAVRPRNTRCTQVVERMLAARAASTSGSP
jgi:hypothetical protein